MFGAGSLRNSYYNGSQPKSFSESGSSSSSLSDLDDITIVKEEPLSPHSSCPPSPNSNYNNPLPSISSINPDLMYDRKVRLTRSASSGNMKLYDSSYRSQPSSLLRDQHLFTSQTCSTSRIKSEPQVSSEFTVRSLQLTRLLIELSLPKQISVYPQHHPRRHQAMSRRAIPVQNTVQRQCRRKSQPAARKNRSTTMRHIQRAAIPTPPANQSTRH